MTEEEKNKLDEGVKLFVEAMVDHQSQELINKHLETTLIFDWKTGQTTTLKDYHRE